MHYGSVVSPAFPVLDKTEASRASFALLQEHWSIGFLNFANALFRVDSTLLGSSSESLVSLEPTLSGRLGLLWGGTPVAAVMAQDRQGDGAGEASSTATPHNRGSDLTRRRPSWPPHEPSPSTRSVRADVVTALKCSYNRSRPNTRKQQRGRVLLLIAIAELLGRDTETLRKGVS